MSPKQAVSARDRRIFGTTLRALRLGFHCSETVQAWVRMSRGPTHETHVVELADCDNLIPLKGVHRVWWEGPPGPEELIQLAPGAARVPQAVRRVRAAGAR